MSDSPAQEPEGAGRSGFAFSPWNLLLLLPVLMLVTPWFNRVTPRIGGVPFFYWYQFAFVLVGVACVWIVYLTTRKRPAPTDQPDRLSVDDLDEGSRS